MLSENTATASGLLCGDDNGTDPYPTSVTDLPVSDRWHELDGDGEETRGLVLREQTVMGATQTLAEEFAAAREDLVGQFPGATIMGNLVMPFGGGSASWTIVIGKGADSWTGKGETVWEAVDDVRSSMASRVRVA